MKTPPTSPAELLAQIAQIPTMERGTLSPYRRAGRSPGSDTYYRLQTWQDGKNCTRHIRPEELPALEAALEGYARYQELSDRYVGLIVARTRAQRAEDLKKKISPYTRHCRRRSGAS